MIAIGKKIFEEVDNPEESKIINGDKERQLMGREIHWSGQIKGIDTIPNGLIRGSGNFLIYDSNIFISNW